MSHDWQSHLIHAAAHDDESKLGPIVLVVMGLLFTPALIGLPILLIGLYKLLK